MSAQVLDFKPNPVRKYLEAIHTDYTVEVTAPYSDGQIPVPKWKDLINGEVYTIEELITEFDAMLPINETGCIPIVFRYCERREENQ